MADLIECVGYKKLAEMRDAENARLLKLVRDFHLAMRCCMLDMGYYWQTDPNWLERNMRRWESR